jgi:hypothetical protein
VMQPPKKLVEEDKVAKDVQQHQLSQQL